MICTVIPQPRGLTTSRDLIRKSFDTLFLSSFHLLTSSREKPVPLQICLFWPEPKLMGASHTGNMDSGEEASFQAPRDTFSTNYSKCLRQAPSLETTDGGSRTEATGPPSWVSWNIFYLNFSFIPSSPWRLSCKSEHEDKIWFVKHCPCNKYTYYNSLSNNITNTSIYELLKHGKAFYLYSLILFSWQSICVIGAIIRKLWLVIITCSEPGSIRVSF